MCINSLMNENAIIQCLLDDLIDRICLINSSSTMKYSPIYSSTKSIENKFNQTINLLNNSLKQYLKYELNTVVQNGQLTTTSNIRHSRYYNPATTIKQSNDLKKKLQWIQQRQMIIQQLNLNQQQKIHQINCDVNTIDKIWFDQRCQLIDNSLDLLKSDDNIQEQEQEEESCARCRIYQRKQSSTNTILSQKLKQIYQIHHEHNYFNTQSISSSPETDLIYSLSKLADRIGHQSPSHVSNYSRKLSSQSTIKKKQQTPKLQSSISLIVGESNNKIPKRTIDELKNLSNSNFISTNFDVTNKRQKRIASPQSSLSVLSTGTTSGPVSSTSPHEILTPSCRILNKNDYELSSADQQENEDISDESYIHRHIRCELEQETWLKNAPATSNRKNSSLQSSLSVPNGLTTTTNSKQYRYHVTSNGIAYTETIDSK